MEFITIEQAIKKDGLRIVIVQGTPSPWGQAAKAMMEYKDLEFAVAAQIPGGANEELLAWAGTNSGPVVAWNDEPPCNRWDDILLLLERLAPQKPLVPESRAERAYLFGLCYEICGELGLGWNRRLSLFQPAMESGQAPESLVSMAKKYRYNEGDVAIAEKSQIGALNLLSEELKAQIGRGIEYFVGDDISAVDFYWASFCNLFDVLPQDQIPLDPEFRQMLETISPEVKAAIGPVLLNHRDRIMQQYFKLPMEL